MYKKTLWKDQNVENPRTYEISQNTDGTYTVLDAFGQITEIGTSVNAQNMNHIEEGIYSNSLGLSGHETRIHALEDKSEDIDVDLINNSKALETGHLTNNQLLFSQIKEYAYSLSDFSSLIKYGDVIVTPLGAISNITRDNFAAIKVDPFSDADNFKLRLKFNTGSSCNDSNVLQRDIFTSTGTDRIIMISLYNREPYKNNIQLEGIGIRPTYTNVKLADNTTYIIELENIQESSSSFVINLDVYNEDGSLYGQDSVIGRPDVRWTSSQLNFGGLDQGSYVDFPFINGTVYLDDFELVVEGKSLVNLYKTGSDVINLEKIPDGITSDGLSPNESGEYEFTLPYNVSKTGSKIVVGSQHRKILEALYKETGCCPYYYLDKEEKEASLPMGEIYGMMSKSSSGMPDYSAGVAFSSGATIPVNAVGYAQNATTSLGTITVDGAIVFLQVGQGSYSQNVGTTFLIPKGSIVVASGMSELKYYPMKGGV